MNIHEMKAETEYLESKEKLSKEEEVQLNNLRELRRLLDSQWGPGDGRRIVDLGWQVSTKMYTELMEKMKGRGYEFESARCLLETTPSNNRKLIETLLDVIEPDWKPRLVEECLQVVERYRRVYDGRKLAELFDHPSTPIENRWVIGILTAFTKPRGIDEWLLEAVLRNQGDEGRNMLCWGIGRLCKKEDANRVLPQVLKEFPWHAARGLSYSGGERELAILKDAQKWPEVQKNAETRNEFKRVIAKIEKRLAKEKAQPK